MYKKKKHIKQKMVILGSFVLGILIAMYIKSLDPNKVYITLDEKKETEREIEYTKKEIVKLKQIIGEYETSLKTYEETLEDNEKSVKDLMEAELDYLKEISGYSKVVGKGIIITIKDSEKELLSGQNPNDLIVHDIDILRILNDLKKSGAKAISINGERVLHTSKIKCSGATITVNDTTYGQPFVIRAIEGSDDLISSMIAPDSYANLLREVYGIYINVEKKNEIIINSYEKNK